MGFSEEEGELVHGKDVLILQWLQNISKNYVDNEMGAVLKTCLPLEQFTDVLQSDISIAAVSSIVKLLTNVLENDNEVDNISSQNIGNSLLVLCEQRIFQQYFKNNLKEYCLLVTAAAKKMDNPLNLINFIKKSNLFPKFVLMQNNFCTHFLEIIFPVLIQKVIEFSGDMAVFENISKLTQRCIFQVNNKSLIQFLNDAFEKQDKTEESTHLFIKDIFKALNSTLKTTEDFSCLSFKIVFHAFCQEHREFSAAYKFFILLVATVGFDISIDFNVNIPVKIKSNVNFHMALKILLVLIDVLSYKIFTECEVANITFSQFITKIIMGLLMMNEEASITFEIISKCIAINPMIIEPIVSQVVPFVMLRNTKEIREVYESVVIAIFNVFAKLHRIENFMSKMVTALRIHLIENKSLNDFINDMYVFKNMKNVGSIYLASHLNDISTVDIFAENILQCFTKCINELASWQVINLIKTLLHHLKCTIDEYADENNQNQCELGQEIFLEILGILTGQLLQSVRIADNTVPQNVVTKFVHCLDDLKDIIKKFGLSLLKREYNHITMRTFLNVAYIWGEVYMSLAYYAINKEVEIVTVLDGVYTASNLTFLHSYLDVKQWQIICQRITNFGEYPCKKLLHNMFVQKLRAMLLFEKNVSEDITSNIVKNIQVHLDDTWQDLLYNKFSVAYLIPKMDAPSLVFLSEHLIENEDLCELHHIKDSMTLSNAVMYVLMTKIRKLFKQKRKHDQDCIKPLSSKVLTLISQDLFLTNEEYDLTDVLDYFNQIFENENTSFLYDFANKENKIQKYLNIFRKFPVIYSSEYVQKIVLIYLVCLFKDMLKCSDEIRSSCEDLITGILQASKFNLSGVFKPKTVCRIILSSFKQYDILMSLIIDNIFKYEKSITEFEPCVAYVVQNLEDPKYLTTGILIVQAVNKAKKSKMDVSAKQKEIYYKEILLNQMAELVCKSNRHIEAYAMCLRHFISLNNQTDAKEKLLQELNSYIEYSLENISQQNKKGCVSLFTTILHNKQKLSTVNDDIVFKIWNVCKTSQIDEYPDLIKLIITLIPNDEFHILIKDLLGLTDSSIREKNYMLLSTQLKTYESVLTCNVNPVKMKMLQEVLQTLLQKLLNLLKHDEHGEITKSVVHFLENIIQVHHFILPPSVIDMSLIIITIIVTKQSHNNFETTFNLSISLLEKLLKNRNPLIMDRLPSFTQQFRILLKWLCEKSNSEHIDAFSVTVASNCAHKLEKLTKSLVACKKDMARIAAFLISDILERYEHINLYSNVKLHLNNCVYSLMSLCDHHAVSYLMRALSSASTEMFKVLYEHYKKYYMFTGKV